ncbi:MAG: Uma2 family endonuclease [Alkalinema sp. RU_4_3]|nr:Uma2 family endonuclease [Alkalinema sp. RU_4_3]
MVAVLDLTTIDVADMDLREGSLLVLHDVSWERYEAIVAAFGERHDCRAVYLDGVLAIMAPMPAHERPHLIIGYIVTVLLDAMEIDWEDFGATTLRKPAKRAGLEPDKCFYIGENAAKVRACMEQMDLNDYPPPDLAIESDVTSLTTFEVYLRLMVPEVWVYRQGEFRIHLLQDGEYVESVQSLLFPSFPVGTMMLPLIAQALQEGTSKMLRDLRMSLVRG